jgi:hypothetical protein
MPPLSKEHEADSTTKMPTFTSLYDIDIAYLCRFLTTQLVVGPSGS